MKNLIYSFLLTIAFAGYAVAQQESAAFSGIWLLDAQNTFESERDRKAYSDFVMEIAESPEVVTIKVSYKMGKRPVAYELRLSKDGRGETNVFDAAVSETSTTKITDRKIIREYVRHGPVQGSTSSGIDEFLLSSDGSSLIRCRTPDVDRSTGAMRLPGAAEKLAIAGMPPTLILIRKK